jgi:subtilisin-like proprotein convertase family protein
MKANHWRRVFRVVGAGSLFSATVCISCGAPLTFSNTNSIIINDSTSPLTKATPYPSANMVTGLAGRVVTKATVTLQNLSHTFPSDVSMLLVGPRGQMAILMAETGGQQKYSVTNLTLTLDDDATNSLPVYTSLTSGTFKPTDGYLILGYPRLPYDFPSPAPSGNSNSVSALSVFKNTDPDGTWNLFVICDSAGTDSGSLSHGWSLNLFVAVPLQIIHSQTNVVISWPASVTNGHLQSSPGLLGANIWSNVTTTPVSNAGRVNVTNPMLEGRAFYRLITN